MNSSEILSLLQNALDYAPNSEYHTGYTAKEIYRKCLVQIRLLDQENQTLREMLKEVKHPKFLYQGWGKGKDE